MAPKQKTQKGGAVLDDGLDSFLQRIQPASFSSEQLAGYSLMALAVTLVPVYLYHSVYDMTIGEYGHVFLALTLAAGALLVLAYRNVEQSTHAYLAAARKTGGHYSGAKGAEETEAIIYQESLAWSFCLNNAIFICSFLFLAFYVMKSVETLYNYILSMAIAAALTWQLSGAR